MTIKHNIYRNGRLYAQLDPARFAVKQFVASYARDDPGATFSACDETGVEYYSAVFHIVPQESHQE